MATANVLRTVREFKAVLTNGLTTTATLDVSEASAASIDLPSGYLSTTFTLYKHTALGSWLAMHGSDGSALTVTVAAAGSYVLPTESFAASRIRIVVDNAGDNAVEVGVTLKS